VSSPYVSWMQMHLGCWYIYGGKGEIIENGRVFDCSGAVTCAYHENGGPDWRQTHSAAKLYDVCEKVKDPQPGDLCFYGPPGKITHVMMYVGDGRVIGASGGNNSTVKVEFAKKIGAKILYRPKVQYRADFRGYGRLP